MSSEDAAPFMSDGDEIEAGLEKAGAENVYLLVVSDCEFCAVMKDGLSELIDRGVVDVLDVERDELAQDIIVAMDESVGVPMVVVETDEGTFVPYQ